jgi:catalase
MWKRLTLWFCAYVWAWVLVIASSLAMRRRMSHNAGTTTSGRLRVVDDPRFPPHDFFTPGRELPCRLRHAPVSYDDDTIVQVRSASLKFADASFESPLDLEMNTGEVSLFWSARNFLFEFFPLQDPVPKDDPKQLRYRRFYEKYPRGLVAAKDGIRRDPTSFAELRYHSQTPQHFLGKDGVRRYVKFRLLPWGDVPETGLVPPADVTDDWPEVVRDGETKAPNYLKRELEARIAAGPVKYRLQLQLHPAKATLEEEDQEIFNCNVAWDEAACPYMDVAVVTIDRALTWEEECRMIYSLRQCPPSLGLIPARSIDDYNSINTLRAASDIAKRVRVFVYTTLGGAPKPQPDTRGAPAATTGA